MIIPACTACPHGAVRNHQSHCSKEKCYSYLTKCIADQALADYLDRIRGENSIRVANPSLPASPSANVVRF